MRRKRVVPECHCPKELTPGDKFMMIQADPFETKYFGAKIPDSSTLASISTPVQFNYTLTTDPVSQPNYAHAWAFYPSIVQNAVGLRGTSPTSWDPQSPIFSDIPQKNAYCVQFEAFRPVAHAIRLSCPYAPTSTTGFVHIAIATETGYTDAGAVTNQSSNLAFSLSQMSNYTFYKRVTLASLTQYPVTLINKWTDETAFRYQSPWAQEASTSPNALTFHIPWSWGTLMVAVEGVSTSTTTGSISPLQAEVVLHTENIPNKQSTLVGSSAAPSSPETMAAVSQAVANTDFAHNEGQQQQHEQSFVEQVVEATGIDPFAVGSSAARALGRYAVGYAARRFRQKFGGGLPGVNTANRLSISN
jgi:hypothetical protein